MRTIIFAALLALAGTAQAENTPDMKEVKDKNMAVWFCFYEHLKKTDDGKVDLELLAKIIVASCRGQISDYEFATKGNPKQVPQDWYDRQIENWKLIFMGSILEKRNEKK